MAILTTFGRLYLAFQMLTLKPICPETNLGN